METKVKERPILFSGSMIRAILAGKKTQTRRVVKPQPVWCDEQPFHMNLPVTRAAGWEYRDGFFAENNTAEQKFLHFKDYCPYGQPGDRLWVRENFCELRRGHYHDSGPREKLVDRYGPPRRNGVAYQADSFPLNGDSERCRKELGYKWKPSIHMPRWASRLTLEVTGVRVERLLSISAKDILAEGAVDRPHEDSHLGKCPVSAFDGCVYPDLKSLWAAGWDSINAKAHPWKSNPFVWVVEFKVVSE